MTLIHKIFTSVGHTFFIISYTADILTIILKYVSGFFCQLSVNNKKGYSFSM